MSAAKKKEKGKEKETATVRVAEGQLRGQRLESRAGGSFWSFQGVPYARPPVGALRFKDALPAEPWDGVRDAFKEGDCCRQFNFMSPPGSENYIGSEDCLYLNVYTPILPEQGIDPLPVMVSIHGGGFEYGSGNMEFQGPDYLVAENVIIVTINYRIGVLGFMYLEEASPGNVGLKDQVAALRWVQRNISSFSGDPDNVTLFGMSAGGASVHYQMLSPMSKGLFKRAIAMSGAVLNSWAVQTDPAETSRRLAYLLGCSSDADDAAIVNYLREVDYKDLVRVAHSDAVPEKDKKRLFTFSFVPTPEKVVPGVETFLPDSAEKLMKEGRHHDIPYITGVAEKEALSVLLQIDFFKENVAKEIDDNWEEKVLPELRISPKREEIQEAISAIRSFFMGGKPLSHDTTEGFINLFSDLTFHEGISYALRCMAKTGRAPLYQYVFTVDDQLNMMKVWRKCDIPGAAHGDDLGYLFWSIFVDPDVPEDSTAFLARRRLLRLWTNFAKTGDPTPTDDPLLGVRWKPYTDEERNYLNIGPQLRSEIGLFADRVAFWEKFYETYGS